MIITSTKTAGATCTRQNKRKREKRIYINNQILHENLLQTMVPYPAM